RRGTPAPRGMAPPPLVRARGRRGRTRDHPARARGRPRRSPAELLLHAGLHRRRLRRARSAVPPERLPLVAPAPLISPRSSIQLTARGAVMSLTLHFHPLSSFCHKVLIALYELDVPFDRHIVDLGDDAARAAFLKLSPLGKMPVLRDDARDRTVPEST